LNDELEDQVAAINSGEDGQVRRHYESVAAWRVRLSDGHAWSYGWLELAMLALLSAMLIHACRVEGVTAGDLLAVFRYAWMFALGLHQVPRLVQQGTRLRDIVRRL
jgi:hypothetical protein